MINIDLKEKTRKIFFASWQNIDINEFDRNSFKGRMNDSFSLFPSSGNNIDLPRYIDRTYIVLRNSNEKLFERKCCCCCCCFFL